MEGRFKYIVIPMLKIFNFVYSIGWFFNFKHNKILKENKKVKNRVKDGRCFVLGNGPSMKSQDLSFLKDEAVFTVNQIARNEQFGYFNPVAHFWMDYNFFKEDNQGNADSELLKCFQKAAMSSEMCFYPLEKKEFIEKNMLTQNAYYIKQKLKTYDGFNAKIDFAKVVPGFSTVVHYAICMALYMGYKEIYLLGCDGTSILSTINAVLERENCTYSYEVDEKEKKRMEEMVKNASVTDYAYSYYSSLKEYEILIKYCNRHGVKLINCTAETALDMIPKMQYEAVVNQMDMRGNND